MGLLSKILPSDAVPKWQTVLLLTVSATVGISVVYYLSKKGKPVVTDKNSTMDSRRKEITAKLSNEKLTPIEIAENLKELGNNHFRAEKYEEAVELYTKAIEICPDDEKFRKATYFQNRAAAYDKLNKLDQVIADSTSSLELNKVYTKAMLRRAKAAEKLSNLELALEDLATACQVECFRNTTVVYELDRLAKIAGQIEMEKFVATHSPKLPSKFFIQTYFSTFRNSKSLDKIDESNDSDVELLERYKKIEANLLEGKHIMNDCNTLIEDCAKAGCKIIENETRLLRATFYVLSKQNELSLQDLDYLIAQENIDPRVKVCALIRRGTLHQHSADIVKRDIDFKQAIEIDGNNADIYHHLGQINLIMEQSEESVKNFRKAISLDKNNPTTVIQHCFAEYKQARALGNTDDTFKYLNEFKKLMDEFPKSTEALTLYAQVLVERQEFVEAENLFNKVIQNNPENSTLLVHKALLMLQWKADVQTAKELILKAIEVDPECEFAYETIATIEMQMFQFDKAAEYYYEAVKRYTSTDELYHLMCVYVTARAQAKASERVGPVDPAGLGFMM